MKKTAIMLMFMAIISKIFGFGREIALSYFYGASMVSDAYLISQTIPGTIFAFIGAGIATGYIPVYTEVEKNQSQKDADKYTSNLLTVVFLFSGIIILVINLFPEFFVKIFASGFDAEVLELASGFTRISIVGILFYGISHILKAYLQIKENFFTPSILGIPFNLIIVIFIIISGVYSEHLLPYGIVIAMLIEVIILLYSSRNKGFAYKNHNPLHDKNIKRLLWIALPVVLGTSVNQINTLVDRTLASRIVIGGISALNYGNRLNYFIQGIIVTSIATVIYPSISRMSAQNNIAGVKAKVIQSLNSISIFLIPSSIGMMLFSKQIVAFLFGRGAFDNNALELTSQVLFYYSLGTLGVGIREVLSRAFYAFKDTKTPMINAGIGMVINILLNVIISYYIGVPGLALATSISALVTALLMFRSLKIKIGKLGIKKYLNSLLKIVFASFVMALAASYLYNSLNLGSNISLIIAVIFGGLIYLIMILVLKVEIAVEMFLVVKKKLLMIRTR